MGTYRSIDVDFDVHKLIELERNSFEESPNEALRRLLKLPPSPLPALEPIPPLPAPSGNGSTASVLLRATPTAGSRPWIDSGVSLPSGTLLRMEYGGETFEGRITDGEWEVRGKMYDSPSGAACALATTRKGKKTSLNGWIYWHVKRPGDTQWTLIGDLWDRVHKKS
jgi:hypothetical protein